MKVPFSSFPGPILFLSSAEGDTDAFNEHLSCLCFNLLFEKVIVWGAEARLTEFES